MVFTASRAEHTSSILFTTERQVCKPFSGSSSPENQTLPPKNGGY